MSAILAFFHRFIGFLPFVALRLPAVGLCREQGGAAQHQRSEGQLVDQGIMGREPSDRLFQVSEGSKE